MFGLPGVVRCPLGVGRGDDRLTQPAWGVGREVLGLEASLVVPQVLREGMVDGDDEPAAPFLPIASGPVLNRR